jgi:hypothetical protein
LVSTQLFIKGGEKICSVSKFDPQFNHPKSLSTSQERLAQSSTQLPQDQMVTRRSTTSTTGYFNFNTTLWFLRFVKKVQLTWKNIARLCFVNFQQDVSTSLRQLGWLFLEQNLIEFQTNEISLNGRMLK